MADKKTEPQVEAVSLDDWVVTPASIDDWVVEDETPTPSAIEETVAHEEPKAIVKEEVSSSAETIVAEPQPVAVGVDDWLVEEDDEPELEIESKTEETTVEEEDLEGPIEIHEDTFSSDSQLHQDIQQTQTLNVDLQGDLAELEESNIEPSFSDTQSSINTNDDDDDLLSDIKNESGMQTNEASFEADEPVHAMQSEELSQSTSERVELDFDENTTEEVIEKEEESFDLIEEPFEPAEPVPSVDDLAFPPTTMENVELDFDSETQTQENLENETSAELEPELESTESVDELDLTEEGDSAVELEPLPEISSEDKDGLNLTEEDSSDELEPLPEISPEDNNIDELDFSEDDTSDELQPLPEAPSSSDVIEELNFSEEDNSETDDLEPLPDISSDTEDIEDLDLSEDDTDLELETSSDSEDIQGLDISENDSAVILPISASEPELAEEETLDAHDDDSTRLIESEEPIALEQTELAASVEPSAVSLGNSDLAETHWIKLTEHDLASHHQLGVLRLTENDTRENSDLAVIRLHEIDFADRHRKVIELDPHFFEDHNIEKDAQGVILLKADDLVDPSCLEEPVVKTKRERKSKIKEVKPSMFTDAMIVKVCSIISLFCIIVIPIVFHFKFSWVTVSQKKYDEIKAEADPVNWYLKTMFLYRTPDSSMRWYGVRKLKPNAFRKAENDGAMMWLKYTEGKSNSGDNWP